MGTLEATINWAQICNNETGYPKLRKIVERYGHLMSINLEVELEQKNTMIGDVYVMKYEKGYFRWTIGKDQVYLQSISCKKIPKSGPLFFLGALYYINNNLRERSEHIREVCFKDIRGDGKRFYPRILGIGRSLEKLKEWVTSVGGTVNDFGGLDLWIPWEEFMDRINREWK